MLSGLTSQLGGLIGGKKNQQPPPDEVSTNTSTAGEDQNNSSATAASPTSQEETQQPQESVLSSVRNHIPSWLGGGRAAVKDESGAGVVVADVGSGGGGGETKEEKGNITPDKGSDASSATGGADSDNQKVSEDEGEAAAAAGANTVGLEKLKSFGTSIFSTIKGAGQKIKETSILGEFQREHESFLKSKGGKGDALAPWVGHPKEEALKEEVLSLSTDRRNFVRSPPTGVVFQWDYEEMALIAKAILKDDPNLEDMRYQLVPKVISEENFWRNYFYRVSLLKESMSDDEPKKKRDSIDTDEEDAALEQELNEELKSFEVVGGPGAKALDDKELDSLLDLK